MSSFADQLEKKINAKIKAIKNGTLPVKGCGVNDLIAKLKVCDEAAAEIQQKDYIAAINFANAK